MKNIVIGILSGIVISGMDFWIFDNLFDRILVGFTMFAVVTVFLFVLDEWVTERRRKKWRLRRFQRMIDEQKNRPD